MQIDVVHAARVVADCDTPTPTLPSAVEPALLNGLGAAVVATGVADTVLRDTGIIHRKETETDAVFGIGPQLPAPQRDSPVPQFDRNSRHIVGCHVLGLIVVLQLVMVVVLERAVDHDPRELMEVQDSIEPVVFTTPLPEIALDVTRHVRLELGRQQAKTLLDDTLPVRPIGSGILDVDVVIVSQRFDVTALDFPDPPTEWPANDDKASLPSQSPGRTADNRQPCPPPYLRAIIAPTQEGPSRPT
jgi:hypothetical protein